MRILMLGNSLTAANDMPQTLAALTGAAVVSHTRGGARLAEHLNPATRLGARTQAALAAERWDFVVLQARSTRRAGRRYRLRGAWSGGRRCQTRPPGARRGP